MVCIVDTPMPGLVCRSHANPLLRALTGYFARKPAIPCLGGAAHAHISGLTCALADPRSHQRVNVRIRGPTCGLEGPRARGYARSEQFRMQFD